ncbi:MAG: nucleotidyltransferase domain-containing protein [Candidatus Nanohaloarchaea archaeon]
MKRFAGLVFKEYEREVLEELLDRPDYGFTVKELSDSVSGSYNSVKSFLERLNEFGIVRFTSKGNYRIVEYRQGNNYHDVLKSIFRVEDSKRMEVAEDYAESLYDRRGDEIFAILVFGSVARGTADKDSDIDILVITESSESVEQVKDDAIGFTGLDEFSNVVPVAESLEEFRNNYRRGARFEENVFRDGVIIKGEDIHEEIN